MLLHDVKGLLRSFAAVNDDRKIYLFGQLQLADKPLPLNLVRLGVPVVVEADLAHSHDLLPAGQLLHPLDFFLGKLSYMVRMNAHGTIDKRIFFRKLHSGCHAGKPGRHVHNGGNSIFRKAIQNSLPVFIKCLIVVMGMTVKYHFTVTSSTLLQGL